MAKKQAGTDRYANKFYGKVTESAANTLTFDEIPTNVNVFSKEAWVLHRLDWYMRSADLNLLISEADYINMALTSSNSIASIALDNPSVIDLFRMGVMFKTAVGVMFHPNPHTRDFSHLPGGGVIIAPRPLYIAIQGVSIAAVAEVEVRGYFSRLEMDADEYLELIDFYRIVS